MVNFVPGFTTGLNVANGNLIVSNGNVGIGDTAPVTKLTIEASMSEGIGLINSGVERWRLYRESASTEDFRIREVGVSGSGVFANGTDFFTIKTTGNVGIGTVSPTQKLDVAGNITAPVYYDRNDTAYYLDPNVTSRMNEVQADRVYGFADIRSPIFYDYNNIAYYLDPDSISSVNILRRSYGFNGPEYDENNGAYYVDPASTSVFNTLYAGVFYYNSDATLKENIQTIPNALASILKLHGVSFDWKEDGTKGLGVVAQEVEQVYPELVATDEKTGRKSVQYGNLVGPLIEAVKELKADNDALRARIEKLEKGN